MSHNNDIVILSDQQDELDDLVRFLGPTFGLPRASLNVYEVAKIVRENQPAVIIYAFQRVDDIRKAHQIIQATLDRMSFYQPQRLLMCKGSEAELAYSIYKEGLIDDFIADRPLYDPHRLRLSVNQALERRQHHRLSNDVVSTIEHIDADMHGLDQFVEHLLASVDEEHHEAIKMFHYLTKKVVDDLDGLHDQFAPKGQRKKPKQTSGRDFSKLAPDNQHLNQTADWLVGLSQDYKKSGFQSQAAKKSSSNLPRVLLVDDDDFYREAFVGMMQGSGLEIEAVDHGGTAIDIARKNPPDVILLDYKMPGIDGLEVLDILASVDRTKHIPVIMLTGISSKYIVDASVKSGAQDFIVKPGTRDVIRRKIEDVLGR